MKKKKRTPSIYSSHTLKPFDIKTLKKICKKYKVIISIEDHSEVGGLGSILREQAFLNKYKGKIVNFSLKDKFINDYGSQDSLLKKHGISEEKILKKIYKLIK